MSERVPPDRPPASAPPPVDPDEHQAAAQEPSDEVPPPREVVTPVLAVAPVGPVSTVRVPSQLSSVVSETLTTAPKQVLDRDRNNRRTMATLISTSTWNIGATQSAGGMAPWPANVPCYVTHTSEVYACVDSSTAELTILIETRAD